MADLNFDIIVVTDPRYQGGTSSAVAAEIAAAVAAGYKVGFMAYEAENLRLPFPTNPRLQGLMERGDVTIIHPGSFVRCRLAILHNPFVAGLVPVEPLNITAEKRLVVAHHPPIDGDGLPAYDLAVAMRNADEILSGEALWTPVGPNARAAFGLCDTRPDLMDDDWANVIDFDAWHHVPRPRDMGRRLRIGRHSRADARKFPATRAAFAEIYGDGSRADVDILGCAPDVQTMLEPAPAEWLLRPYGDMEVRAYLDQLDAFVYYHRDDWVEAFGYAVVEAMARGVPCVLSPTLAASFGKAARIVSADQAFEAALEVAEDPSELREAGYALIAERHSFHAVAKRIEALIGPPAKVSYAVAGIKKARSAALLVSTNGIGMGHLTRTLAIARRIPEPITPIIVTMSHGAAVAEEFGYHVEFIPYHSYLGTDIAVWNCALRDELQALIDAHEARVVIFDGNSPFQGLLDAMASRPKVWSIWSRRGMWRSHLGAEFIAREKYFDAVIEPRDLAGGFDKGPTRESVVRTRHVDPIRLLDRQELLPAVAARAELGLDAKAVTVLLQLGGGNNFDLRVTRDLVLRHLGGRAGVQVVLVSWKISATPLPKDMPANVVTISTYPVSRYLNAFDFTISAVGYNSFHEASEAGLPALYVPNENPAQDDQLARAQFIARRGAALVARRDQPETLIAAIEEMLDAGRLARMRAATNALRAPNGAVEAARLVAEFAQMYRGQRD